MENLVERERAPSVEEAIESLDSFISTVDRHLNNELHADGNTTATANTEIEKPQEAPSELDINDLAEVEPSTESGSAERTKERKSLVEELLLARVEGLESPSTSPARRSGVPSPPFSTSRASTTQSVLNMRKMSASYGSTVSASSGKVLRNSSPGNDSAGGQLTGSAASKHSLRSSGSSDRRGRSRSMLEEEQAIIEAMRKVLQSTHARLYDCFAVLDVNGKGALSKAELLAGLLDLNLNMKKESVQRFVDYVGRTPDGLIRFQNFWQIFETQKPNPSKQTWHPPDRMQSKSPLSPSTRSNKTSEDVTPDASSQSRDLKELHEMHIPPTALDFDQSLDIGEHHHDESDELVNSRSSDNVVMSSDIAENMVDNVNVATDAESDVIDYISLQSNVNHGPTSALDVVGETVDTGSMEHSEVLLEAEMDREQTMERATRLHDVYQTSASITEESGETIQPVPQPQAIETVQQPLAIESTQQSLATEPTQQSLAMESTEQQQAKESVQASETTQQPQAIETSHQHHRQKSAFANALKADIGSQGPAREASYTRSLSPRPREFGRSSRPRNDNGGAIKHPTTLPPLHPMMNRGEQSKRQVNSRYVPDRGIFAAAADSEDTSENDELIAATVEAIDTQQSTPSYMMRASTPIDQVMSARATMPPALGGASGLGSSGLSLQDAVQSSEELEVTEKALHVSNDFIQSEEGTKHAVETFDTHNSPGMGSEDSFDILADWELGLDNTKLYPNHHVPQIHDHSPDGVTLQPTLSEAQESSLRIKVHKAVSLDCVAYPMSKYDAYCTCKLGKDVMRKTEICHRSLNPVWEQEFKFDSLHTDSVLNFQILNHDRFNDTCIGTVSIPIWPTFGLPETVIRGRQLKVSLQATIQSPGTHPREHDFVATEVEVQGKSGKVRRILPTSSSSTDNDTETVGYFNVSQDSTLPPTTKHGRSSVERVPSLVLTMILDSPVVSRIEQTAKATHSTLDIIHQEKNRASSPTSFRESSMTVDEMVLEFSTPRDGSKSKVESLTSTTDENQSSNSGQHSRGSNSPGETSFIQSVSGGDSEYTEESDSELSTLMHNRPSGVHARVGSRLVVMLHEARGLQYIPHGNTNIIGYYCVCNWGSQSVHSPLAMLNDVPTRGRVVRIDRADHDGRIHWDHRFVFRRRLSSVASGLVSGELGRQQPTTTKFSRKLSFSSGTDFEPSQDLEIYDGNENLVTLNVIAKLENGNGEQSVNLLIGSVVFNITDIKESDTQWHRMIVTEDGTTVLGIGREYARTGNKRDEPSVQITIRRVSPAASETLDRPQPAQLVMPAEETNKLSNDSVQVFHQEASDVDALGGDGAGEAVSEPYEVANHEQSEGAIARSNAASESEPFEVANHEQSEGAIAQLRQRDFLKKDELTLQHEETSSKVISPLHDQPKSVSEDDFAALLGQLEHANLRCKVEHQKRLALEESNHELQNVIDELRTNQTNNVTDTIDFIREEEMAELRLQNEKLSQQLIKVREDSQVALSRLQVERRYLEGELKKKDLAIQELKQENDAQVQELDLLQSKSEALALSLSEAKEEYQKLQLDMRSIVKTTTDLNSQVEQSLAGEAVAFSEARMAQAATHRHVSESARLAAGNEIQARELARVTEELKAQSESLRKLVAENSELALQVYELERQVDGRTIGSPQVTNELQVARKELKSKSNQLDESRAQVDKLDRENVKLKRQIKELRYLQVTSTAHLEAHSLTIQRISSEQREEALMRSAQAWKYHSTWRSKVLNPLGDLRHSLESLKDPLARFSKEFSNLKSRFEDRTGVNLVARVRDVGDSSQNLIAIREQIRTEWRRRKLLHDKRPAVTTSAFCTLFFPRSRTGNDSYGPSRQAESREDLKLILGQGGDREVRIGAATESKLVSVEVSGETVKRSFGYDFLALSRDVQVHSNTYPRIERTWTNQVIDDTVELLTSTKEKFTTSTELLLGVDSVIDGGFTTCILSGPDSKHSMDGALEALFDAVSLFQVRKKEHSSDTFGSLQVFISCVDVLGGDVVDLLVNPKQKRRAHGLAFQPISIHRSVHAATGAVNLDKHGITIVQVSTQREAGLVVAMARNNQSILNTSREQLVNLESDQAIRSHFLVSVRVESRTPTTGQPSGGVLNLLEVAGSPLPASSGYSEVLNSWKTQESSVTDNLVNVVRSIREHESQLDEQRKRKLPLYSIRCFEQNILLAILRDALDPGRLRVQSSKGGRSPASLRRMGTQIETKRSVLVHVTVGPGSSKQGELATALKFASHVVVEPLGIRTTVVATSNHPKTTQRPVRTFEPVVIQEVPLSSPSRSNNQKSVSRPNSAGQQSGFVSPTVQQRYGLKGNSSGNTNAITLSSDRVVSSLATHAPKRLHELFDAMDVTRTGRLTRGEFRRGIQTLDNTLSRQEVEQFIHSMTPDADGCITFNEFFRVLRSFNRDSRKSIQASPHNRSGFHQFGGNSHEWTRSPMDSAKSRRELERMAVANSTSSPSRVTQQNERPWGLGVRLSPPNDEDSLNDSSSLFGSSWV